MPAEKWTTNIMNNAQAHSHRQHSVQKKKKKTHTHSSGRMWQQQSQSSAKRTEFGGVETLCIHYWAAETNGELAHRLKKWGNGGCSQSVANKNNIDKAIPMFLCS